MFHSNFRSLSKHIDELQILLRSTEIPFDIIGISETKEQVDSGFLTNVNLHGFDYYSQPSKTSAGYVAIYIKSSLNYVIRNDLNKTEDEFECIWVEIKTLRAKIYCVAMHIGIPTVKHKNFLTTSNQHYPWPKRKKATFYHG